jgi:hypothetical protein
MAEIKSVFQAMTSDESRDANVRVLRIVVERVVCAVTKTAVTGNADRWELLEGDLVQEVVAEAQRFEF